MSQIVTSQPWKIRLPKRLSGGRIEKWVNYWENVAQDYKEVTREAIKESRQKPFKAATYISLLAGILYAIKDNPDELEFQDALQTYMNESQMLSDKIRNKEVDDHFNYIRQCYNHGLIRRLNIYVCTFLWVDNYGKDHGIYKAQCSYLKPQYLTFHERILDVGFMGRWWIIGKMREDFDINVHEWNDNRESEKVASNIIVNVKDFIGKNQWVSEGLSVNIK